MAIENTFTFSVPVTYYGKFRVSTALNQEAGSYYQRDTLADHGVYSADNQHPSIDGVQRANLVHAITGGTAIQKYQWDEETIISEEDVSSFIDLIADTGASHERTDEATVTLRYTYQGDDQPWKNWQAAWGLKSAISRLEAGEGGLSFVCVTHVQDDVQDWIRQHGDVAAGGSFTFEKPVCEECYLLFSQPVTLGGTAIEANKIYKVASEQISIVNPTEEPCKMLRFYK
jgi:hypothetical protein